MWANVGFIRRAGDRHIHCEETNLRSTRMLGKGTDFRHKPLLSLDYFIAEGDYDLDRRTGFGVNVPCLSQCSTPCQLMAQVARLSYAPTSCA